MAKWQITVSSKGLKQATVNRFVNKLKQELPAEASVSIKDASPPVSRADRLAEALSMVGDARSEIESLKEELESWKEGLPENLQSSSKADELDEAIDGLQTLHDELENAEGSADVSFPQMY